jgi:hypothetical protein
MGMLRHRRAWRALVGCAVAAATVGTVSAAPADADAPVATVTPSRVTSGQTVTVTASGFPSGDYAFIQCSALYVDSDLDAPEFCRLMGGDLYNGVPGSIDDTVLQTFETLSLPREVDCMTEPGGCVVGVQVTTSTGDRVEAWAPIEFWDVGIEPRRGLADGDSVAVTAGGLGDGAWSVAQCTPAYAAAGGPAQAASECGPATEVTAAGGSIAADLVVRDPLVATDGTSHDCGYTGCVMVIARPGEAPYVSGLISFGPPSIAIEPAGPIAEDQEVTIRLAGMPGTRVIASLCAQGTRDCVTFGWLPLDVVGAATVRSRMDGRIPFGENETHDCRVEPCVLSAFADETNGDALAAVPVTFLPPPEMTLAPSVGLLDGQEIGVEVSYLAPDTTYDLVRCWSVGRCEPPVQVTSSATGVVTTTATASQVAGTGYCRNQCYLALRTTIGREVTSSYAMAEGSTHVAPATGLVDGQEARVTGTELMPTYAGRQLGPWPTGGWAVVQCDAAITEDVSLYNAFDDCAGPPIARAVTIAGSTVDEPVTLASSFTTILGRQVDCTAAPGACVVGLYRFEQDASSTGHFTPVTFGI